VDIVEKDHIPVSGSHDHLEATVCAV